MPVELTRLIPDNAALLRRVAEDVFDDAVDPERLAAYLAEPGHLLIVASEGDLVVGQCAAVVHRHIDQPTELYIDNLGVTPDLRRQGIARRLVEAMFAWGRELGCEEAWVATEPDNVEARGLYASQGDGQAAPVVMYEYEL